MQPRPTACSSSYCAANAWESCSQSALFDAVEPTESGTHQSRGEKRLQCSTGLASDTRMAALAVPYVTTARKGCSSRRGGGPRSAREKQETRGDRLAFS